MCQSTWVSTRGIWGRGGETEEKVEVVHFGTYNIQNGCNGGLESALHGMAHANIDLGLLKETLVTGGVYAWDSTGLFVVASDSLSHHHRGVAIFYKYSPCFAVKYQKQHDLNVIRFQLVKGRQL